MGHPQHQPRIIPLHGPERERPDPGCGWSDVQVQRTTILHPAAAQVVNELPPAVPVPPEIGFWNGVPVRKELADMRDNPLTWAIMEARRNRMKAYLPLVEVTTMLMLTVLGVLIEHFALLVFGDWK
jgi:hypothetical protein